MYHLRSGLFRSGILHRHCQTDDINAAYDQQSCKIITLKQLHKNVRDRASPLIHRCRQPISAQRTGAFCKCGYPWDRLVRDPQSHRHDQAS